MPKFQIVHFGNTAFDVRIVRAKQTSGTVLRQVNTFNVL